MFIGDKYWTLRTKDKDWLFEDEVTRDIIYFYGSDKDYSNKTGIYYFSTKKAAENYIICNKPCLSLREVLQEYNKCAAKDSPLYNKLKATLRSLIKSKL